MIGPILFVFVLAFGAMFHAMRSRGYRHTIARQQVWANAIVNQVMDDRAKLESDLKETRSALSQFQAMREAWKEEVSRYQAEITALQRELKNVKKSTKKRER